MVRLRDSCENLPQRVAARIIGLAIPILVTGVFRELAFSRSARCSECNVSLGDTHVGNRLRVLPGERSAAGGDRWHLRYLACLDSRFKRRRDRIELRLLIPSPVGRQNATGESRRESQRHRESAAHV